MPFGACAEKDITGLVERDGENVGSLIRLEDAFKFFAVKTNESAFVAAYAGKEVAAGIQSQSENMLIGQVLSRLVGFVGFFYLLFFRINADSFAVFIFVDLAVGTCADIYGAIVFADYRVYCPDIVKIR